MTNLEKVNDFLSKAQVFYLTTVDGDNPKCRPVSFHMLVDDHLYFGVGTFKEVYRQMTEHPQVEICACVESEFLRYYGTVKVDSNPALLEQAMEALPMLREIYNEKTGYQLALFCLSPATAEFRSMLEIKEKIEF